MSSHVTLAIDKRLLDDTEQTPTTVVVPALVLYRYLRAELSLGEAAELLNQDHDEFLCWLNALGVPTLRPMADDLEADAKANADALLATLVSERH